MMKQWCMLALAIIAEVTGTTMLKLVGQDGSASGYAVLLTLVGLSYFLLSKAVVKIPLSVAYAAWEGLGLIAVTAIGWGMFGEGLPPVKLLGVAVILAGIVLLKRGMVKCRIAGERHE